MSSAYSCQQRGKRVTFLCHTFTEEEMSARRSNGRTTQGKARRYEIKQDKIEDRQTDKSDEDQGNTDRQTDRQTDGRIHRRTDRRTAHLLITSSTVVLRTEDV
jgi:hypothetical protein